jgi:hypothetical protein
MSRGLATVIALATIGLADCGKNGHFPTKALD